jgi:hypothetical protein
MNLSFHKKVIFGFILFFVITLFTIFIWKVGSEYYHTEVIYYEGEFPQQYHFRSSDALLLINNLSDHPIFLQYKKYVYIIAAGKEEIFDVRNLSPIFLYKDSTNGLRSIINKYYKTLPTIFFSN